nr:hypothetical protein [Tanacetum cinerariifolium]
MSDNIPFDIQMQIIKKIHDVMSLIQFRSISKQWKSFVDSSEFINWYDARNTQPHSFILSYKVHYGKDDVKYIRLAEDGNNESFMVQKQELAPSVVSPLIKQFSTTRFVVVLRLYGHYIFSQSWMSFKIEKTAVFCTTDGKCYCFGFQLSSILFLPFQVFSHRVFLGEDFNE